MSKSKFTKRQTQTMQELRNQGQSITDIASKFNTNRNTIYRLTQESTK